MNRNGEELKYYELAVKVCKEGNDALDSWESLRKYRASV